MLRARSFKKLLPNGGTWLSVRELTSTASAICELQFEKSCFMLAVLLTILCIMNMPLTFLPNDSDPKLRS